MTRILQWNIQWCRGMDGRVDPARIARLARERYDPDVVCLQEVAVNYPDLGAAHDQPALLAAAFPGYSAHFAVAVDTLDGSGRNAGGRRQFGNMVLSRLPVHQVYRHTLPWPADPEVPSMPRIALEAVIEAPFGLVGLMTTHLEYFSSLQRAAQVERLIQLKAEVSGHSKKPPAAKPKDAGPFAPMVRPAGSILTGDFNMKPEDPLVARLNSVWRDAWSVANPGKPNPPTFCVHDDTFSKTPYCCDFVFVSEDLAPRISQVKVDLDNQASDHQPVILELR